MLCRLAIARGSDAEALVKACVEMAEVGEADELGDLGHRVVAEAEFGGGTVEAQFGDQLSGGAAETALQHAVDVGRIASDEAGQGGRAASEMRRLAEGFKDLTQPERQRIRAVCTLGQQARQIEQEGF